MIGQVITRRTRTIRYVANEEKILHSESILRRTENCEPRIHLAKLLKKIVGNPSCKVQRILQKSISPDSCDFEFGIHLQVQKIMKQSLFCSIQNIFISESTLQNSEDSALTINIEKIALRFYVTSSEVKKSPCISHHTFLRICEKEQLIFD